MFQLGTNKVRQLAITTVFLSGVIIFSLGTLTVRQLSMTISTLCRIASIVFGPGTNEVGQLAITAV